VRVVSPDNVRVQVSGPKSSLADLSSADIAAYVDAKGLKAGSESAAIQVDVPDGMRVVQISKSQAKVEVGPS
ncbi:MAG: hypothetical protein K6T68_07445, partial [Alicyclobacillus shizuokensis]|nr:hypothetical protein [Alicyclobacillus shizuokensis]